MIDKNQVKLIEESGLFDREWYLNEYLDVKALGMNPVEHYLRFGLLLKRNPSTKFNLSGYLYNNPDVVKYNGHPIIHYIKHGIKEKRSFERKRIDLQAAQDYYWWAESESEKKVLPFKLKSSRSGLIANLPKKENVKTAILIPIYNAPEDVENCLNSLVTHNSNNCRVIAINDCSPDKKVAEVLAKFSSHDFIEIYQNEQNLGFTKTINKGIELAGTADVVFLNSDTIVTPYWLEKLRIAAYSSENIATVTPLSNNAGAFSVPVIGEENFIPKWSNLDDHALMIAQISKRIYLEVPTGNGFCLYVRRSCIDKIGKLDEIAFPKGYGEENDFCMRAIKHGFKNIIDNATYIYHVRSASFGETKTPLMKAGRDAINERYPDYSKLVKAAFFGIEFTEIRKNISHYLENTNCLHSTIKRRALYVVSTRTGGTPQTNQDLMAALSDKYETFVLRSDRQNIEITLYHQGKYYPIAEHSLMEPINMFPHTSKEYDEVVLGWLHQLSINLLHIRHIAWHSLNLSKMAKLLEIPVIYSFHDFYTLCPTVNLIDENNKYCDGICTKGQGECKQMLWPNVTMPDLKHNKVFEWRSNFTKFLNYCDHFITTASSGYQTITKTFPNLKSKPFDIIPHGRNFPEFEDIGQFPNDDEEVRILVPGNIGISKGSLIFKELQTLRASFSRPVSFHFLGKVDSNVPKTEGFVHHGAYKREDFYEITKSINPHFGIVLSIWAETFCHTLTEMWSCGIPVLGADLGAVSDRINASGGGWLIQDLTATGIIQSINLILENRTSYNKIKAEVSKWQKTIGNSETTLKMAHRYDVVYKKYLSSDLVPPPKKVVAFIPKAKIIDFKVVDAPGSSHIRLLEKFQSHFDEKVSIDFFCMFHDKELSIAQFEHYDAFLIQRDAFPISYANEMIENLIKLSKPIFFELDDDLLELSKLPEYAEKFGYISDLMQKSDLVITSTKPLKKAFDFHKKVVVSPNALSTKRWNRSIKILPKAQVLTSLHATFKENEINLLYMGTNSHLKDLEIVREAFINIKTSHPNFSLYLAGVSKEKSDWYDVIEIPKSATNYPEFVNFMRNIAYLFDFAIAPLEANRFNQGKSHLKFLEYFGMNLFGIYSNVTPYKEVILHKKNGYLASNNAESWQKGLAWCIENKKNLRDALLANEPEEISKISLEKERKRIENKMLSKINTES